MDMNLNTQTYYTSRRSNCDGLFKLTSGNAFRSPPDAEGSLADVIRLLSYVLKNHLIDFQLSL